MNKRFLLPTVLLLVSMLNSFAATFTVNMSGTAFSPATLSIAVGDTVTWVNQDFVNHNTVSGATCGTPSGVWASPLFGHAGTFSFTFNVNAGSYPYYCTPHCSVGMKGTITVTNGSNVAPSVTMTNPANNAVIAANTSFQIGASASDTDGTVTNVAFFAGANLISNDSTSPYSATTSLAAGSYTLSAVASDNSGAKATNSISITVNAAPTISLSPSGPYTVDESSNLNFSVVGNDTDALTITSANLPSGATLSGTGNTRTFSWTPNYGQSYGSAYSVSFIANDGINPSVTNSTTITVNPVFTPIDISSFVSSSNQSQFHVSGVRLTRTNFVQVSTNLPSWTSIKTNISTNTAFDFIDTNATAIRFYRVLEGR